MFVCNILLKCPKNLVNDILRDGKEEIKELFGDEDIQQLLALPEDLPTININMAKRLERLKITQTSIYIYIFILFYLFIYFFVYLGNLNVQKVLLKNKISTEYDCSNLRNLLQQLHKMDMDPMFNILDTNYEVSNKF